MHPVCPQSGKLEARINDKLRFGSVMEPAGRRGGSRRLAQRSSAGVYEKKRLIFVAEVKNGFVPRIRDALFPALKALQTAQCPFRNLPEKRASRCPTLEALDFCRHAR